MADKPEQNDNDKTLVLSLKQHLPAKGSRGLAKAPETRALTVAENAGLANIVLDLNPIVTAAAPLIAVISELKLPEVFCDVDKLRRKLVTQIKEFENNAKLKGVPAMNVLIARYVLCAALDEAVLYLPQSEESGWASQSLLSTFHEDAGGGEKFFTILERMNQDPALNIDMLELMYLLLSLGFEGKYRVMDGGYEQLRMLRESLYQRISQQRKCELPQLAGSTAKTSRLKRITLGIPFRQVFATTAVIVFVIYLGFALAMHLAGNSTAASINKLVKVSQSTDLTKSTTNNTKQGNKKS